MPFFDHDAVSYCSDTPGGRLRCFRWLSCTTGAPFGWSPEAAFDIAPACSRVPCLHRECCSAVAAQIIDPSQKVLTRRTAVCFSTPAAREQTWPLLLADRSLRSDAASLSCCFSSRASACMYATSVGLSDVATMLPMSRKALTWSKLCWHSPFPRTVSNSVSRHRAAAGCRMCCGRCQHGHAFPGRCTLVICRPTSEHIHNCKMHASSTASVEEFRSGAEPRRRARVVFAQSTCAALQPCS
jgi:hypothetical protein